MKKKITIWSFPLLIMGLSLVLASACKKDSNDNSSSQNNTNTQLPALTTAAATNIGSTSATCAGTITAQGASSVITSGVSWNTSPNPTIDIHSSMSTALSGSYTCNISGLTPNTTYYVRAFAMNNNGVGYGNQVSFKTTVTPTGSLSATIDGVPYVATSVTVGTMSGQIGIAGMNGTKNLLLWLLSPPTTGAHALSQFGDYMGQYTPDGASMYTSDSGTINISVYNSGTGEIKGTFSFVATYNGLTTNITNGQFDVYN